MNIRNAIDDLAVYNEGVEFMLKTRIISAAVGLPLIFFIVLKGGVYLQFFLILLSMIGLYEFYNVLKNIDIIPIKIFGYLSILFFYLTENLMDNKDILILITMIIFSVPIFINRYNIKDVSLTIIGIIYVLFFSYIGKLRELNEGYLIVWFVFIISWLTDTFAYFTGRFFGKTKLCSILSPNKTLEGAIGGIFGSIFGSIIFTYLFFDKLKISILFVLVLSISGSVVAQVGDLFASSVKRYCHIKDYGNIIPGHGGIIDRFDSILYVAPYVYFMFNYLHMK
ncbi:MAG: phosphatidate cytidylyltransferase [Thermoanaerobacteraceae bacterium]|nr:phosphatidate cytidylyltransferase [Thermoanaerobacteraceae bacterium]